MAKKKKKPSSPRKASPKKPSRATKAIKKAAQRRERIKRREALWNPKDGVTQSLLNSWAECPEQTSLRYLEGWTPKQFSIPLEFGSIMHYAIENQFSATPEEVVHAVTDSYRQKRLPELRHPGERDQLDYCLALAEITFPRYCRYWEESDNKREWIEREGQFDVPLSLELPGGTQTIRLRGMKDGIYRNSNDNLSVFETKNLSRINQTEIQDGLRADMQTLFYSYATWLEKNECPTEVLYNIIRRSDMYKRKDDKLGSLIKRIKEDIDKRPDHYFMRFKITMLKSDIASYFENTLKPLIYAFFQWYEPLKKNPLDRNLSPSHFRNLKNLITKYGKSDMWELMLNNNQRDYYLRSEVFPELKDSIQSNIKAVLSSPGKPRKSRKK